MDGAAEIAKSHPIFRIYVPDDALFKTHLGAGSLAPNLAVFSSLVVNYVQVEKHESDQREDSVPESSSGCSNHDVWVSKAPSCCSGGDSRKPAEGILRTQDSGSVSTGDWRAQDSDFAVALRVDRSTSQVIDSCQALHIWDVANHCRGAACEADRYAAFSAQVRFAAPEWGARGAWDTGRFDTKEERDNGAGRRSSGPDCGWCGEAIKPLSGGEYTAPSAVAAMPATIDCQHSGADCATGVVAYPCAAVCSIRQIHIEGRRRKNGFVKSARHGVGALSHATKSDRSHFVQAPELSKAAGGVVAACRHVGCGKVLDKNGLIEIKSRAVSLNCAADRKLAKLSAGLVEALDFGVNEQTFRSIRKGEPFGNSSSVVQSRCGAVVNRALVARFSHFHLATSSGEIFAHVLSGLLLVRKTKHFCISSLDAKNRCAGGSFAICANARFYEALKLNGFFSRLEAGQKYIRIGELIGAFSLNARCRCGTGIFELFGGGAVCGLLTLRGFFSRTRNSQKHIRRGELFDTSCPGAGNPGSLAVDLASRKGDRKFFIFPEFSGIVRIGFGAPKYIRTAELFRTFSPGVSREFSGDFAREGFAARPLWAINSGECLTEINAEKLPDFSDQNSQRASSESITGINSGASPDVVIPGLSESINGINVPTSREFTPTNHRQASVRIGQSAGDSPFEQTRLADSSVRTFPLRAGSHAGCASTSARAPP